MTEGRLGCGPDEGPPTVRPERERLGMPSRFSLISLFRELSGMLQATDCEAYCDHWRKLDNVMFELGSRMFGQKETEDAIQAIYRTEEDVPEEPISSESDVGGLD